MYTRSELLTTLQKLPVQDDDPIFQKLADALAGEAIAVLSRLDPLMLLTVLCNLPAKAEPPVSSETPKALTLETPAPEPPTSIIEAAPEPAQDEQEPSEEPPQDEETPREGAPVVGTPEWYEWKKQQRQKWEQEKQY